MASKIGIIEQIACVKRIPNTTTPMLLHKIALCMLLCFVLNFTFIKIIHLYILSMTSTIHTHTSLLLILFVFTNVFVDF